IRQLHCNLIITPPISLALRPRSQQLDSIYGCHFLRAVQLRRPDEGYLELSGPGGELMEKALAKRVDLDGLIPDPAARRRLIAASGGAIRELVGFTSQVALVARGDTITLDDVDRMIARRRGRMRDLINANGWMDAVVALARDKQLAPDPACL